MLAILDSSDSVSVDRLLDRRPSQDPAVRRRVASIVAEVKKGGDEALRRLARRFDGLDAPLEVTPEEMAAAARAVPAGVRRAIVAAARNIRLVAHAQLPRTTRISVAPGLSVTERVVALDRVGCYVPGGRYPLPSSLLMTAIPAKVAGVREVFVACPRPDPVVMIAAVTAGVTRLFRIGGAQAIAAFAYGTATIPAVDKIVGPGNRYVAAAKDLVSADCAIDFHAGPSEVVVLSSSAPPAWVAADLLAQAEHDPDARALLVTTSRPYATKVAREVASRLHDTGPAAAALFQHGAIIVCRTADEAVALVNRIAPEHVLCSDPALAARITRAGTIFVGDETVPAAGDYATGSNHVLPTAGAARFRGGLSAADFVRVIAVQEMSSRALAALAPTVTTLARAEGLEGHARSVEARTRRGDSTIFQIYRFIDLASRVSAGGEIVKSSNREMAQIVIGTFMDYSKPPSSPFALRLHLNENTAGCSPKVLEAIRAIDAETMAVYPDYEEATTECARALGVDRSWVVLTNGLDEGIWAAAAACIRAGDRGAEAVVPEPAFDMYAACVQAAGGRVVHVPPGPELAFPADALLAAVRPATRIVYLCSPNNPSGLAIPAGTVSDIARRLPPGALLFLDEAYVDFARESFLPLLAQHPNVILGRTFAKAYGLAALRIGCLVAQPETVSFVLRVIPPYSLNVCAIQAMRAALQDAAYREWYCAQVVESKQLVYEACGRFGLPYWPSEANFVLVRVGSRCGEVVEKLAGRGILIRDRSGEPGCAGCVRITAGVVEHTRRCLAALEEVL